MPETSIDADGNHVFDSSSPIERRAKLRRYPDTNLPTVILALIP